MSYLLRTKCAKRCKIAATVSTNAEYFLYRANATKSVTDLNSVVKCSVHTTVDFNLINSQTAE